MPVHVSDAPLLIQFSANGLGKAEEDGPRVWGPATHMGDMEKDNGFGLAKSPQL